MNTTSVSASELAEYIYCECCWIDKLEGLQQETLAMQKGTQEHEEIRGKYFFIRMIRRIALICILISVVLLIAVGFLYYIYGITL